MIINIRNSILFTVDPDIRFSKQYGNQPGTLKDIYRRYKILGYTIPELCDFYEMKTGNKSTQKSMKRWIWRTEIYIIALPAINSGAQVVTSAFFKKHEWRVIKEITKNLKSSVRKKTKTLL